MIYHISVGMKKPNICKKKVYFPLRKTILRAELLSRIHHGQMGVFEPDAKPVDNAMKRIFIQEPLVSLTREEVWLLREQTRAQVEDAYTHFIGLANNLQKYRVRDTHESPTREASREDMLRVLSDGRAYGTMEMIEEKAVGGVGTYGSRSLEGYGGIDVASHAEKQFEIKKRPIRVLDVGSCTAQMLYELKQLMGNKVETHALVPNDEPHCNVDSYHLLVAEQMPESFRGYFDVIVSNMAIEYMLYAHHVLHNITEALAPGGVSELVGYGMGAPSWFRFNQQGRVHKGKFIETLDRYLGDVTENGLFAFIVGLKKRITPDGNFNLDDLKKNIERGMSGSDALVKSILAWCKEMARIEKSADYEVEIVNGNLMDGIPMPSHTLIRRK